MTPTSDKRDALKDAVVEAARKLVSTCAYSRPSDCAGWIGPGNHLRGAIDALDSAPPEEPEFDDPPLMDDVEGWNAYRDRRMTKIEKRISALESRLGKDPVPSHVRPVPVLGQLPPEPPAKEAEDMIDILFDGPPGPVAGRFVEVESPPGTSIKFGEWIERADGFWALRIQSPRSARIAALEQVRFEMNLNKYDTVTGEYVHAVLSKLRSAIEEAKKTC